MDPLFHCGVPHAALASIPSPKPLQICEKRREPWFNFLLSCQVRMGLNALKVSGLSLYPKHPSQAFKEAQRLCIAIYFKCLIKIS